MVRDSLTERAARSHANAAGFSIPEKNIDSFLKNSNDNLNDEDFKSCYFVDYVLDSNFDDIHSLGMIIGNNMDCFGNGVDEVKVIIKNIPLCDVRFMGENKDTVKVSNNNVAYMRFKDFDFAEEIVENQEKTLTVYGSFNINEYYGKKTLQLFIDDYEFNSFNKRDF